MADDLSDEAIAARQMMAAKVLRGAINEFLDAHHRLDDDDFLDTFIVMCRITSTEVGEWYLSIDEGIPRDSVIGIARICQRQAELSTESHAIARAIDERG